MNQPKILIQLDTDAAPSVFDSVVACDCGAQHLLRQVNVTPESVRDHVYGAIFTRAVENLNNTAIFIGGSDVSAGEAVLAAVTKTFFGPMRVSVMVDSGGANTTAAAAVLAAERHVELNGATALVLAATGPVGQRVVRLLAGQGAAVRVASRDPRRAEAVTTAIGGQVENSKLSAQATNSATALRAALDGVQIVIAAGAAGVELLPAELWQNTGGLKVAIDLNAVPPLGIAGIEAADRARERDGTICYGAIGVGQTKMKIHKAALRRLFETNDVVLDVEQIYELGRRIAG